MPFVRWHKHVVKKIGVKSGLELYLRTIVFSVVVLTLTYVYTAWMGIPNVLNKSVADTSIIVMGLSMLLSSVCYFWNFADTKIIYRKYLGLVGFGYMLWHIWLSWDTFLSAFAISTWLEPQMKPVLAGLVAMIIFIVMAIVSNNIAAYELGGMWWRRILHTGYLAVVLVFLHVFWLKSARWITWWQDGAERPPSMSLLVSIFMLVVIVMRVVLWLSLLRRSKTPLK